ncbi:MAG: FtsQ-type POTRA domain-containing protein, partial [Planctomycetota bacterium]
MRKKSGVSNYRAITPLFGRRRHGDDESDWLILEADLAKPRPSPVRRRRLFASAVKWLGILCLGASLWFGGKWAHRAIFFQNEEFVLRDLDVRTDGSLSVALLTEVANVAPGMSLMKLDLDGIQDRIAKLPVVEEVVVSREMPDKLNIMVRERIPVAWLSCPPLGIRRGDMERGFLIDADGCLFRCLDATEAVLALPLVEVFKMEEPEEGTVLTTRPFEAALSLLSGEHGVLGLESLDPV